MGGGIDWKEVKKLRGKNRDIDRHQLEKAMKNDPSKLDVSALRLFLTGSTLNFGLPRDIREAIVEICELRNKEYGHRDSPSMPRASYEEAVGKILALFRLLHARGLISEEQKQEYERMSRNEMSKVVLGREEQEEREAEVRRVREELLQRLKSEVGEREAAQRRADDALAQAANEEHRRREAEAKAKSEAEAAAAARDATAESEMRRRELEEEAEQRRGEWEESKRELEQAREATAEVGRAAEAMRVELEASQREVELMLTTAKKWDEAVKREADKTRQAVAEEHSTTRHTLLAAVSSSSDTLAAAVAEGNEAVRGELRELSEAMAVAGLKGKEAATRVVTSNENEWSPPGSCIDTRALADLEGLVNGASSEEKAVVVVVVSGEPGKGSPHGAHTRFLLARTHNHALLSTGTGKSMLSEQFARHRRLLYERATDGQESPLPLFWVLRCGTSSDAPANADQGSGQQTLRASYTQLVCALCPTLTLAEASELLPGEQRRRVEEVLKARPGFVLVFDNVLPSEMDDAAAWFPSQPGLTGVGLVTTQDSVALPSAPRLRLQGMDPAESQALLLQLSGCKEGESGDGDGGGGGAEGEETRGENRPLAALCEFLGHHPLAVAQAGSFIRQARALHQTLGFSGYLELLRYTRTPPTHATHSRLPTCVGVRGHPSSACFFPLLPPSTSQPPTSHTHTRNTS